MSVSNVLHDSNITFTFYLRCIIPQNEIERIETSDDGMFWMSFEDLVKHFYSVNVCMVRLLLLLLFVGSLPRV
jgi:hypothetical protein